MIIVQLQGGMGNQMFEYALGRALSLKYKVPLGLDLSYLLDRTPRPKSMKFTFRDYDLDVFNVQAEIVPQSKIPFTYRRFLKGKSGLYLYILRKKFFKGKGTEKKFNFDESVFSLGARAYLKGYWQSPKYFDNIADTIRKDFTLKNLPKEEIQNLYKEMASENSLCIHVRRTDFIGNSLHQVVKNNYYERGIDYLKKTEKIEKIYVFSDDIAWCKDNMKLGFPTVFIGPEYSGQKAEGNLFLMSACKYFIIPNSTFSWWGAWLSARDGKKVIVPQKWFDNPSINTTDIIPEEWIKI